MQNNPTKPIVLHFNVSNALEDIGKLNRFLLALVTGLVTDQNSGRSVRFNRSDTILLEWPSEGITAMIALNKCPLVQAFSVKERGN